MNILTISRMNTRGAILDLYLVFITLFMCGAVIIAYMVSISHLDASLVSPIPVLELADEAYLFAQEEYALLKDVYCEYRLDDAVNLEERYCAEFNSLSRRTFLTDNSHPTKPGVNGDTLCSWVYEFTTTENGVRVERDGLIKIISLSPENANLAFPMRLSFNLEREYLLTPEDCL